MPGKKWCEYCRVNLPYTKKDIEDHEATRNHLQNKQKAIKYERIKIRKERNQKSSTDQPLLSTANIPKAKKGSQLEQQVQAYRDSVINEGKSAIHRLIAEKTQGSFGAPIEYPEKQELVIAENYEQSSGQESSSDEKHYEMWKIDICEQTGDPCFINRVTKAKLYEPPKGYVLSEEQKQEWEYLQEVCKDKVEFNPEATVHVTEWEQVPAEEDYFALNKAEDSDSAEQQVSVGHRQSIDASLRRYTVKQEEVKPEIFKKEEEAANHNSIEERLNRGEISTNEVLHEFIEERMSECRTIKEKNENLKKLIENGLQIRSRPSDEIWQKLEPSHQNKPKVGFKPRKKVKVNQAQLKLTSEHDI